MIRVLLCEHRAVSSVLRFIHDQLDKELDIEAYDECTLADVPALSSMLEPDVVIIMTGYPPDEDWPVIRRQRELHPHAKIIALALAVNIPGYAEALKEAGVALVIPTEGATQLAERIRELARTPLMSGQEA